MRFFFQDCHFEMLHDEVEIQRRFKRYARVVTCSSQGVWASPSATVGHLPRESASRVLANILVSSSFFCWCKRIYRSADAKMLWDYKPPDPEEAGNMWDRHSSLSSSTVQRSCHQQSWTLQRTAYCQLIRDANIIKGLESSRLFKFVITLVIS